MKIIFRIFLLAILFVPLTAMLSLVSADSSSSDFSEADAYIEETRRRLPITDRSVRQQGLK